MFAVSSRFVAKGRVLSVATSSTSKYFSSMPSEANFMVRNNTSVDPRLVKVPYLRDSVRQEMYARHVLNPEQWSVPALSQRYRTSIDRTKAAIVLMQKRYDLMRSKGFDVKIEGGEGDQTKPNITVEVPAAWKGLYDKHKEDTTIEIAQILQTYNESVSNESLKLNVSAEKAKEIVETVADHHRRLLNVEQHNNLMEDLVQKLRAKGVDSQRFQETANDVNLAGNKKSMKDSYYPSLFGDDDLEDVKQALSKRIAAETKAHVEHNVEYYQEKFHENNETVVKKVTSPENASRWKLAFRDLSKVDVSAGSADVTTTVIRSRKGELRKATPLEEAQRSWNVRPSQLDVQFNTLIGHHAKRLVEPFVNVDKDDHLTKDIPKEKLAKNKHQAKAK